MQAEVERLRSLVDACPAAPPAVAAAGDARGASEGGKGGGDVYDADIRAARLQEVQCRFMSVCASYWTQVFKTNSDRFREALYALTGFMIEWNYKTSVLRLRSMYAEQESVSSLTALPIAVTLHA